MLSFFFIKQFFELIKFQLLWICPSHVPTDLSFLSDPQTYLFFLLTNSIVSTCHSISTRTLPLSCFFYCSLDMGILYRLTLALSFLGISIVLFLVYKPRCNDRLPQPVLFCYFQQRLTVSHKNSARLSR